jgi:sulfatase maturation enzyme AslB (radical SAM superfamily)
MIDKWKMDGCKLLWHMERVEDHFKHGKRIAPIHIDIGATKICNAKCIYCYGMHQKMDNNVIPPNVLKQLFIDAAILGVKSIAVVGDGEPTLNPGLYNAVTAGNYGGLDISVGTNGIALNEEKLFTLLSNCKWIRFNLSGIGKDGYKEIHGVDMWETVRQNIETAVRIKNENEFDCTIGLQMVLVPQCAKYVIPISEFAVKTGVDYFVIKQFSDPGCDEMSRFALNWYDNDEILTILKKAERLSTEKTRIVPKWNTISEKGEKKYDNCVDCPLIFQISGSGKCYPCGYLFGDDRYCYGDLNKQSLGEILRSEQYWNVIQYMRTKFNVHTDCKGSCRHDSTNKFMWEYLHKPEHITFI